MATNVLNQSNISFPRERRAVSNAVLGMSLFIASEVMFFTALIAAFFVIKAGYSSWAPPEGVRLPIMTTALNTGVLLFSGLMLHLSHKAMVAGSTAKAKTFFLQALVLGATFVGIQGFEWVNLIRYGMSMLSGIFGATFFLIIGAHGLHAVAAVIAMAILYRGFRKDQLTLGQMTGMKLFWFFVVGVWPILYTLVYF